MSFLAGGGTCGGGGLGGSPPRGREPHRSGETHLAAGRDLGQPGLSRFAVFAARNPLRESGLIRTGPAGGTHMRLHVLPGCWARSGGLRGEARARKLGWPPCRDRRGGHEACLRPNGTARGQGPGGAWPGRTSLHPVAQPMPQSCLHPDPRPLQSHRPPCSLALTAASRGHGYQAPSAHPGQSPPTGLRLRSGLDEWSVEGGRGLLGGEGERRSGNALHACVWAMPSPPTPRFQEGRELASAKHSSPRDGGCCPRSRGGGARPIPAPTHPALQLCPHLGPP